MDSLGSNKSIPLFIALVAVLAIGVIAAVGSWAASGPGTDGSSQAQPPVSEAPPPGAPQKSNPPATAQITEEEAHRLVWAVPEVQARAEQIRQNGSRPVTVTIAAPEPSATSGTQEAAFLVRLSEDRGDHIAAVETFAVDAYSRDVSVYDVVEGRRLSLDEWRGRR